MTIGHCKHGEFELEKGCPQCIAERMGREGNTEASIAEEIAKVNNRELDPEVRGLIEVAVEADKKLTLVKVQYYSEGSGEISPRQYTYYSVDRLEVGDKVTVPVRDTTTKAMVTAIDVPDSEVTSFRDKVKTIPALSIVIADMVEELEKFPVPRSEELVAQSLPLGGLAEAAKDAGAEVKVVKMATTLDTKINLCDTCSQEELLEAGEKLQVGDAVVPGEGGKYYKLEPVAETALVLRTGEDVEVHGYFEESQRLLEFAVARLIGTLEDNKAANDDLIIISKLKRRMEDKRKEYLEPLKAQSDAIRATYNELMGPVLEADQITRGKMLAYTTEQDRIREEQEKINRKRLEAAEAEMRLNGELTESVNLVEVIPEAPKRTQTDLGTSGQKSNWKWEVIDFALVPDDYKIINPATLTPAAKSYKDTRTIPGIRIYNEPIIAVRAR